MNEQVTVFLIPEQAKRFILFQKYYEPISKMIDSGLFEQKNASMKVYFDNDGVLQTIERADFMYKRLSTD